MTRPRRAAARLVALGFAVSSLAGCSALNLRRWREPEEKWFTYYEGPVRPLEDVAVLCRESEGPDIATIRRAGDVRTRPARHERWHFPLCIEAPAGDYVLEVNYFSRDTVVDLTATVTETMESTVPTVVEWHAEAGSVYLLRVSLGSMAPLPGLKPRPPREQANTQGRWYVRDWRVSIDRLAGWDELPESTRMARAAWKRHVGN